MAVEFLHELKVPFFKVGSGDTNNFPYLEKTAKKGEQELSYLEKWLKHEIES